MAYCLPQIRRASGLRRCMSSGVGWSIVHPVIKLRWRAGARPRRDGNNEQMMGGVAIVVCLRKNNYCAFQKRLLLRAHPICNRGALSRCGHTASEEKRGALKSSPGAGLASFSGRCDFFEMSGILSVPANSCEINSICLTFFSACRQAVVAADRGPKRRCIRNS